MCFSAPASFLASGLLAATGTATLATRKLAKRDRLYAAIPFLFAVQQAIEGFQWLVIDKTGSPNLWLGYAFVLFAYFLWPVYLPLSVARMEPDEKRKFLLHACAMFGTMVALMILWSIVRFGLPVEVLSRGITYGSRPYPSFGLGLYAAAVCGALLLSSHFWVRVFGISAIVSLLAALAYSGATHQSVWCFFAAVLSVLVFLHVRATGKRR